MELTHSQLRMWFMHTIDPERTDLTIACAAQLTRRLGVVELQDRLHAVVEANPVLSAVVADTGDGPQWSTIDPEHAVRGAVRPALRAANAAEVRTRYEEFTGGPWRLDRDVPWAVQLVTTGSAEFLFCAFHHLVCDGDRSLRLFLAGLSGPRAVTGAPVLADLLESPRRTAAWDEEIAQLAGSVTDLGDLRERIALPAAAGARWSGVVDPAGLDPDERDEVALLRRLAAATADLVGPGQQLLAAIPFDGCTPAQQDRIGYFGNPGLAVLRADEPDGSWARREYARAEALAGIPFQAVMADAGFRAATGKDHPFDVLLVPRSLLTFTSPLVRSVTEPAASRTPYALVLNHWRDDAGDLRVTLESAVFCQEVLDHLGAAVRTGEGQSPEPPPGLPVPVGVDGTDLVARLETVVAEHQDAVAVETPSEERLTYGELWAHATELAETIGTGLAEDRRTVAIVGDKHPNEIACVLGTHLAGGTVLRLDRDEAATTRVLAGLRDLAAVVRLDDAAPDPAPGERTVPGPFGSYRLQIVTPGSGARPGRPSPTLYITLTSGSTGEPKLIPFPRAAFNSLLTWHLRTFPGPRRTLQFSKLSFDVAYHVIYATLCGGGTLVTANALIREDPKQLLDYLDVAHVQKLYLPTVLLRPLAEHAVAGGTPAAALREVIVAGGGLEITDEIRAWFTRTSASLFNHYGTSETQDVTSHLLAGPPENWPVHPPAGLPIDGVEVRIAGPGGRALPASLAGSVVARTVAGDMATGDLGYYDLDGRLHIIGRADRVIKRRGFRVDLQAIEATVAREPGIADAVAVSFPAAHGGTTIAVVATEREPGGHLDTAETAQRIAAALGAGYEFALLPVPGIPRLANAKPDLVEIADRARRLLSTTDRPATRTPASGGVAVLHAVRDLVGADVPEDARFLDAGLDSISLMSLAAALRPRYPGLTIADFFAHPTIAGLQAHLDHATAAAPSAPAPRARELTETEVAVVGMAGRFPGASDVDTLWANLRAGRTALERVDRDDGADSAAGFVGVHGNLSDVDEFDHEFFGITPAEARRMDPQVRVFLELCWHALEDAGEVGDLTGKNVGVFAGSGLSTYLMNEIEPDRLRTDRTPFLEHNTLPQRLGNDRNYLTSTVSYRLGLTGPSIVVLAACATSLTAVHMARQALLNGECDLALAGGVSIIYPQPAGYTYVDGSVRSKCGACRPFDQHADGSVFGNGAGVVVLKRASDAKTEGNTVHAEVVGSAVNHDGSVKGSFSAPNPASQTRVIDAALLSAGGDGPRLDFVEAHGTATSIGDAIEWNALLASRVNAADGAAPCLVGSVKSNIGHLDEAAGIAGFIKACLSVRDRVYPGTHGFTGLHPQLDGDDRFTVSGTTSDLPADRPVHGGISSFGMGGANCHVIVRSPAPEVAPTVPLARHAAPLLLPVSARTGAALTDLADLLADRVRRDGDRIAAADVVHTLSAGRRHFPEFRGVLRWERDDADLLAPTEVPDCALTRRTRLVWAFPGQGSGFSWPSVAELGGRPVFAHTFRTLLAGFADHLGPAFTEHVGELTGETGEPVGGCPDRCTVREQVLQFSFQLALARLLSSFGVEPDAVVGHSLGEITAAVCADRLTEDAALALVARRALLMDSSAGDGFMAQLRCDRAVAAELAADLDLDVAAVNGPRQVVVAGDAALADDLVAAAARRDVPVTLLPVDKAFHSRMMAGAAAGLADLELGGAPGTSVVEFVGTNAAGGDPADGAYWTSQLTSPVAYAAACDTVLSAGARTYFVEVGFGATLANLLRAVAGDHAAPAPVLAGGVRDSVVGYLAAATATAYQSGRAVSWAEVNQTEGGRLTRLPAYPFKRTAIAPRPEAGTRAEDTFELSPARQSWLREHRVDGRCVVPAAGILALFAKVARDHGPGTALSDVLFEWPVVFDADTDRVEALLSLREGVVRELTLSTRRPGVADGWVRNASAVLTDEVPATDPVRRGDQRDVPAGRLYTRFAEQRLGYGPGYRRLDGITAGEESAGASWTGGRTEDDDAGLGVTAGLVTALDGIVQLADVLDDQDDTTIRMPAHIAYAAVHPVTPGDEPLAVHAGREPGGTVAGSLRAGDAVVADLTGIRFQTAREARPVAHRQRWRAHVPVGADLPPAVAGELTRLSALLSAPDGEVAEYQRQVGLLEAHAVRALAGAGEPPADPAAGTAANMAAQRRHRAFGRLAARSCPEPDESPDGAVTAEWSILRSTAAALPDYFSGTLDGESILFSGDGADRLRSYYQNSFLLNRLNRALPDIVLAVARANAPRAVRVLEVGGGTGATTERVLDALDAAGLPVDYTFTDISDGLVRLAAERFGRRPGFRSVALDLESDAAVAALAGDYDVIVAVDVIHVTRDVERTVDRLAGTLTPSGTLLVVEDLKQLAWVDVTFGLLDSWWSFDDGLRADHPLLPLATWRDLLSSRFAHLDVLRACLGVPIEDTVADEGLFVCAGPRRAATAEPAVLDLPAGVPAGDRVADLAGTPTAVVRFDTPAVLDPEQAEWFAATLLEVLRAAEEHPELTDVVIATPDAVLDGATPRVLTAGSMAAALTRVAANERRRVRALSLATDTGEGLAEQVRTFLTHGHPHVNGAVLDGQLHLPHVVADEDDAADAAEHDRDAAVLFGGTSEIAAAAAEWLHLRAGVDRLYLVGRSSRPERAAELAARLPGAEVTHLVADVTDPDAVRAVAGTVAAEAARPLVLNLAAVLRDGTIDGVGPADLAAVLGPKVRGSHTVTEAFRGHGARFVWFSSTSALLGNAGQAAHAMACAYLDGLAEADPANTASVRWGPWEDVGITARLGMNDRLRAAGEKPLAAAVLLPRLGHAAAAGGGTTIAADLDSPALRRLPFLAATLPVPPVDETAAAPPTTPAPGPSAGDDVVAWAVASVLGVPEDAVDADRTLAHNGVDSLHLIEVRSLLEQRTGVRVPLNTLADAPSLAAVRAAVGPAATGPVVFYVAGIFGALDAAPDLEDALAGSARLVTLSSPTRDAGSPARLDLATVAADLADRVEREQPAGPVTIAGHSFGARLAHALGVELRGRGRDLRRVVVIDGDPVAAPADRDATDAEFAALMDLRAGGELSERSRAAAYDAYRANCAIARSPQPGGELACPVLVVVPEQRTGVGLEVSRVDELRTTGPTELGGAEIAVARVPGDHFTMLRSPNVTHLADHLTAGNSEE